MDATQAVIHFIGLVLFSTQVSNDPGLHAILPAIRHDLSDGPVGRPPTSVSTAPASDAGPGAAPAGMPAHVEPHIAVLVFPRHIIANDAQWPTSTIVSRFAHATALASYNYVELTGEHITFVVDAPGNDFPAEIPTNMPRFSCGRTLGLTPAYQWPYSKAAAVVDIPEGTLSVCEASTLATGRVDTRLVLNTTGTLTVLAVRSGIVKTLVLHTADKPTIFVANVPPPRVNGTRASTTGAPHFEAYFNMIGRGRTSSCTGSPRVDPAAPPVPDCDTRPVFKVVEATTAVADNRLARKRMRLRPPVHPTGPVSAERYVPVANIFIANAECSNTQWP